MKTTKLRNYFVYPFENKNSVLSYIEDKNSILIACNAEKILKNDQYLEEIVNNNIAYPDGIGAVLALKKKGFKTSKIPGVELWLDIIERFEGEKSFYLLGSKEEVIEKTVSKLKEEFPKINIKGYRDGYFQEDELGNIKNDIKDLQPDVVFVTMGSPKQEYLMNELFQTHQALYMGLGGSFDIYCGLKNRAPKFFIFLHLEWLYRLLKEPVRINRQLKLVKFVILLMLNKI